MYFIMAQGPGDRWVDIDTGPFDIPLPASYKQLIPILPDVTILDNTIKQLRAHVPMSRIKLVAWSYIFDGLIPELYKQMHKGGRLTNFSQPGTILDGVRHLKLHLPFQRTPSVTILLGDVIYSDEMMFTIVRQTFGTKFYGRIGPNLHTGKEASELFAIRCRGEEQVEKLFGLSEHIATKETSWIRKLWGLYRMWAGYGSEKFKSSDLLCELGCFTDDIDSMGEYVAFGEALLGYAREELRNRIGARRGLDRHGPF